MAAKAVDTAFARDVGNAVFERDDFLWAYSCAFAAADAGLFVCHRLWGGPLPDVWHKRPQERRQFTVKVQLVAVAFGLYKSGWKLCGFITCSFQQVCIESCGAKAVLESGGKIRHLHGGKTHVVAQA